MANRNLITILVLVTIIVGVVFIKDMGDSSSDIENIRAKVDKEFPINPNYVMEEKRKAKQSIRGNVEKELNQNSPVIPDSIERNIEKEITQNSPAITDSIEKKPSRIFYNNVGKCASTTVIHTLKRAGDINNIHFAEETVNNSITLNSAGELAFIKRFNALETPVFFHKHVYFPDFAKYGFDFPELINVIREPFDRLVSVYYYTREMDVFTKMMSAADINRTLDECVAQHRSGCFDIPGAIPYFCGQDPQCQKRGDASLQKAIQNVNKYYGPIGVSEDLKSFFQVMEVTYPTFFKGVSDIYSFRSSKGKQVVNKTKKRVEPSSETKDKLASHLKFEYDFYQFIKQRFYSYLDLLKEKKLL